MMFKEYLENAWAAHATNPEKVAEEFKQNFSLMSSEEDVMAMSRLIVHVCGNHLGDWLKGIELLRKLKNNATIKDAIEMNRYMGILNLGNNPNLTLDTFSTSDQVRIYASTAAALASLGGLKNADKLLKKAVESVGMLTKEDPANKALAIAGNNIAQALEEKSARSESEIELMIFAAKLGRTYWEISGGWKEIERAEYRLASSFLKAGHFDLAFDHAQNCFNIVVENNSDPLELFFAYEILALVEKERKNETSFKKNVEQLKLAYIKLRTEDQPYCEKTLRKIEELK